MLNVEILIQLEGRHQIAFLTTDRESERLQLGEQYVRYMLQKSLEIMLKRSQCS